MKYFRRIYPRGDWIQKKAQYMACRNSETCYLVVYSGWWKIQESQQREIKLTSKNVWRKRKAVQKNQLIGPLCEAL